MSRVLRLLLSDVGLWAAATAADMGVRREKGDSGNTLRNVLFVFVSVTINESQTAKV